VNPSIKTLAEDLYPNMIGEIHHVPRLKPVRNAHQAKAVGPLATPWDVAQQNTMVATAQILGHGREQER
jgi:hypothetical protein